MLTKDVFHDRSRKRLKKFFYLITPVTQLWKVQSALASGPRNDDKGIAIDGEESSQVLHLKRFKSRLIVIKLLENINITNKITIFKIYQRKSKS